MEKRIFTAVLVSIGFLWLWAAMAPRLFPDLVKPRTESAAPQQATTTATTAKVSTATAKAPAPKSPVVATPVPVAPKAITAPAPTTAKSVSQTVIRTDDFIATFSNRGAQLVSFKLNHFETKPKGHIPVELVKAREPSRTDYPFAIEARDANLTARLNSALYEPSERREDGAQIVEFRYAGADGVSATKTFRFTNEYNFKFSVAVNPPVPYRVSVGPGIRTLEPDEKDSQFTVTGNGVVQRNDDLKVINREKSDRTNIFEEVQFVGVEDNYFLVALRPEKYAGAVIRAAELGANKEKRRDFYVALNGGSDGVVSGNAFFGPKQTSILDRYGFERALQFGMFGVIARFFLTFLAWINRYTNNWGWAIVVLTIIIKVALYPLQHKWMLSMKKIQKVQPKMEAIKAKYRKSRTDADQRQKMNAEMMKLYQVEGINPAGGCLPMLIQFPIFVGFYNLLSHAIELRGAPFMLWIQDLSAKDPYYITPILMTAAMFVQQMITPTSADPAQRKMFLIMPLVFGWIFKEFPSGLVLYWLVQNILTIAQQMIMNRYWKDHPDDAQTA